MPQLHGADALAATRHVVVLLRLTVGASGRVLYGEVVDPETRQGMPFHGLAALPRVLRSLLAAAASTAEDHQEAIEKGDRPDDRAVDPTTEH